MLWSDFLSVIARKLMVTRLTPFLLVIQVPVIFDGDFWAEEAVRLARQVDRRDEGAEETQTPLEICRYVVFLLARFPLVWGLGLANSPPILSFALWSLWGLNELRVSCF